MVYLPENEQECCDVLKELAREEKPFRIIGNGSNLIIDDSGLPHFIICTRHMERVCKEENESVNVDAGYPMAELAYQSASKELSGLEFSVGIPGSIGGVVRMNAGAHQHTISETVHTVNLVLAGGHLVTAY